MTTPEHSHRPTAPDRDPYVGVGEDGARRSSRIDREEAEDLAWSDPRRDQLLASADRWDEQAYELMLQRVGPRPDLDQVWQAVGSEAWLTALALLRLSPTLYASASRFAEWSPISGTYSYTGHHDDRVGMFHPTPVVAWQRWLADIDRHPRGWSSTEHSLFQLVAALVDPARTIPLVGVLDYLGSWEGDAWRLLTAWGTGGNNRDHPGRYTVRPATTTPNGEPR